MKAVILTAGLGTRFLPMTKAIPKAMLPILNKPIIQYLAEEALSAGITDLIIVTGRGGELIERHFGRSHELAHDLKSRGKETLLKPIEDLEKQLNIAYVEQDEAKGDGHAILCAKHLLEGEDFAVIFGDDIIDTEESALKQLLDVYKETNSPVICTQQVPEDQISNYGVIEPLNINERKIAVKGLVEKPKREDAPSNYGIIGKYICTAEVLNHLAAAESSYKDGEIRLIDGFRKMLEEKKEIYALEVKGTRFDAGNEKGLLEANIAFGKKAGLI
ncbi:UTP--glucose-1-phosphate uridylyltransferase [Candidatus Peregrinibacteria bacterium]|jgi:UTP--glucose-1-phosphate uridylyltransferase|nr:UTP--glucose-1-phosphate uridylyltransferase [Candidatus Peregrinibacteria bacterium]MBT4632029.1 UTP--glucose-1-phosphate uridylyltransferase [Candidatus Peregrinibacteria bacterium]MBT5516333.1 UTP--glucose-1-phosphate uridylyltransferase [Candidatus Peregrinibacteria bacterium]MBT5824409.1 UTP--glucose-1-phosphate uridylyltransferase [Candidatus Peregrinibacteria bacterium]